MIKKISAIIIICLFLVGCGKPATLLDFLNEESNSLDLDGEKIVKTGSVAEIFSGSFIQRLYGIKEAEFDPADGTMHLMPETFDEAKNVRAVASVKNTRNKSTAKVKIGEIGLIANQEVLGVSFNVASL